MKYLFIFLSICLLLPVSAKKGSLEFSADELKIIQLTPNLYQHITYLPVHNGKVPCNGMIWVKNKQAVVFDATVDSLTSAMLINQLQKRRIRVKAVISHHFHEDCTGGLAAFHKKKIKSFASAQTIKFCLEDENNHPPQFSLNEKSFVVLGGDTVFTQFFGPAHTMDNMISYIPSELALFGGCAVKELNGRRGYLGDANVQEWSKTIIKVQNKFPDVKTVVPGHGNHGGKELLQFTIELFAKDTIIPPSPIGLDDFYEEHKYLNFRVDSIYKSLSDTLKIAQMIVTSYGHNGKEKKEVDPLVKAGKIGGIIYMKGTHSEHLNNTLNLNRINGGVPIIYSMDAEPSLMKGRITTLAKVPKTNEIRSVKMNEKVVQKISNELNSIGVRLNYAPDCDLSTTNKAIGSRSYGSNVDSVVTMANSFINSSFNLGTVTCAKHFPGHGLVKGDSHHTSVFIDGELKELETYKKLVKNPKLLSVMVGHIDVINNEKYNTKGIPSSCSSLIIKQLLKQELGFKGLVISDALGMKALSSFEVPGLEASKAGCDILCMPKDETKLLNAILKETQIDSSYAKQIEQSVKKIIRLKICLGLIHAKPTKKIISYQHGKIVEDQGVNAASQEFGEYEYTAIIKRFEKAGFDVIGSLREKRANPEFHAARLSQQVDSLLICGYSPSDITLLGASKGAWITLLASTKLSTNRVNIITLGICGQEVKEYFVKNKLQLKGQFLSIYEKSDNWGQSCQGINFGNGITGFKELEINTGLKHGFLFKPLDDWVLPVISWAKQ